MCLFYLRIIKYNLTKENTIFKYDYYHTLVTPPDTMNFMASVAGIFISLI